MCAYTHTYIHTYLDVCRYMYMSVCLYVCVRNHCFVLTHQGASSRCLLAEESFASSCAEGIAPPPSPSKASSCAEDIAPPPSPSSASSCAEDIARGTGKTRGFMLARPNMNTHIAQLTLMAFPTRSTCVASSNVRNFATPWRSKGPNS